MAKKSKLPVIPKGYEGGGKSIKVVTEESYYPIPPKIRHSSKELSKAVSKPSPPMPVKVVGPVKIQGGKRKSK